MVMVVIRVAKEFDVMKFTISKTDGLASSVVIARAVAVLVRKSSTASG